MYKLFLLCLVVLAVCANGDGSKEMTMKGPKSAVNGTGIAKERRLGLQPGKPSGRAKKKPMPLLKKHAQIRTQCRKFKIGVMKTLCNRLASDPIVYAMGKDVRGFANVNEAARYARRPKPTPKSSARALSWALDPKTFTVSPPRARSLSTIGFNCDRVCPDYSSRKGAGAKQPISLSPWTTCSHYDPFRFPQWLKLGLCLCDGCINPKSGKEDLSYVSEPITANITVLRRNPKLSFDKCTVANKGCKKEIFSVTMGCHCALHS